MEFRSGYVNIIGKPNVGKSTLINALLKEKVSIISPKVQTTRHRILGILNGEHHQVIFSDTPGIIPEPKYKLHESMMRFVNEALEDADVMFYLVEASDRPDGIHMFLERIIKSGVPLFILVNKIDLMEQDEVVSRMASWAKIVPEDNVIPLSALRGFNTEKVLQVALENLPVHPPYFPVDQYTDRTERFLVSEVIREKIFNNFRQEIPYSSEVIVTAFKEEEKIIRIAAEVIVERQTQKGIIIGKGGEALKRVGTEARKELEEQFQKKIFLEVFVKVRENWKSDDNFLRQFGHDV